MLLPAWLLGEICHASLAADISLRSRGENGQREDAAATALRTVPRHPIAGDAESALRDVLPGERVLSVPK